MQCTERPVFYSKGREQRQVQDETCGDGGREGGAPPTALLEVANVWDYVDLYNINKIHR